ncbi:MAG: response regulator transcription factor [Aquificae bacterium]|nr:response regulator transcription factor [Aquificota bacterium]
MKILIVSFDKTLTEGLEANLQEHEVFTAKNAEEALTLSPKDVDVIIFDAISGAISEEEINQLYEKKFQEQKYVILYDELFPIDVGNLKPPRKVLLSRDLPPEEIVRKALSEEAEVPPPVEETKTPQETPQEERAAQVLVVSFDKKLTDSLEEKLGDRFSVEVVKNMKLVKEKGKGALVIVYDAISGSIAEKNLLQLAEDPVLREKNYIILQDELFPINVEKINLPHKVVIGRDTPVEEIAKKVEELIESQAVSGETVQGESEEVAVQEEEEELLQIGSHIPEETGEEEKEEVEKPERPEGLERPAPAPELPDEKTIKAAIIEAIARELHGLREELKSEVSNYIKDVVESVVREEVEKYLTDLRINEVIRETTRRVVEQKIRELLQ